MALALIAAAPASAQENVAGPVLKEAYDLYQAAKLQDAAVKFEQGLRLNPTRDQASVAFFLLGETYRQLGDDFKAKANYEASLQANPNSQVAAQARERLAGSGAAQAAPAPQTAQPAPAPQGAQPAMPRPQGQTAPPPPPPSAQAVPPRPPFSVPPGTAHPGTPPQVAQSPRPQPGPAPAQPPIDLFRPGTVIKDCELCPAVVVLPTGTFQMGSNSGDGDEKPVHPVTIARPIAMGRFEVTFAEYDACLAASGCRSNVSDNGWGRGANPVIHVTWTDANDYVRWLSATTGRRYRLPTEAEWEFAARGGSPAGDVYGKGAANCDGCGSQWDNKRTAPVGRFPPNPYGLYDMLGNAWEWTLDCWVDNYRAAPPDGSPRMNGDCSRRVLRGGGYKDGPDSSRAANRNKDPITDRDPDNGFRVVRELP